MEFKVLLILLVPILASAQDSSSQSTTREIRIGSSLSICRNFSPDCHRHIWACAYGTRPRCNGCGCGNGSERRRRPHPHEEFDLKGDPHLIQFDGNRRTFRGASYYQVYLTVSGEVRTVFTAGHSGLLETMTTTTPANSEINSTWNGQSWDFTVVFNAGDLVIGDSDVFILDAVDGSAAVYYRWIDFRAEIYGFILKECVTSTYGVLGNADLDDTNDDIAPYLIT